MGKDHQLIPLQLTFPLLLLEIGTMQLEILDILLVVLTGLKELIVAIVWCLIAAVMQSIGCNSPSASR